MTTTVQQLLNDRADRDIHSVTADALVLDAIRLMAEKEVGALLVIEGGRLKGMLSERDYTRKVVLRDRSSSSTRVEEIMTRDVVTVTPENNIDECMVLMSENHIRHLPVLKGGKATGMISILDVLQNIIADRDSTITQLSHYITDPT